MLCVRVERRLQAEERMCRYGAGRDDCRDQRETIGRGGHVPVCEPRRRNVEGPSSSVAAVDGGNAQAGIRNVRDERRQVLALDHGQQAAGGRRSTKWAAIVGGVQLAAEADRPPGRLSSAGWRSAIAARISTSFRVRKSGTARPDPPDAA